MNESELNEKPKSSIGQYPSQIARHNDKACNGGTLRGKPCPYCNRKPEGVSGKQFLVVNQPQKDGTTKQVKRGFFDKIGFGKGVKA